jgi:S-adenosyl-L-methionine hydrolase (adenosine-forming)
LGPIITLLTDFGSADSYVAEVRAVLLNHAHNAQLVDVTHEVAPGDIQAAQYLLARVWHRFPAGSVHLIVVDPGVGGPRRGLAAETAGHFFVAPDNGLLSALPAEARFVSLPVPSGAAPTFHARDVFAPAAAKIAIGTALTHLGPVITDPHRSPLPLPRVEGDTIVGEVIYVDRFGTLITNIPGSSVRPGARVRVAGRDVGTLRQTFVEADRGQAMALVGSGGTLEVAVRDGSAAHVLGVSTGAEVRG